jgi:hypothetical protein
MTDSDGSSGHTRRHHIVRLALFAVFLLGLFYLVAVTRVVDVEDVRRAVAATGPAAPLTYVVVSALLGAVFVPGPILAAGSGVLFGPVLGTFVTLASAVGTATVTSLVGRRAGRDSARELLGKDRADRLDQQIQRRGRGRRRSAIIRASRMPGLHAFGALGAGVADGRRGVHRVGTAGVRLHGPWRVDRRLSPAYSAIAVWCVTASSGLRRAAGTGSGAGGPTGTRPCLERFAASGGRTSNPLTEEDP